MIDKINESDINQMNIIILKKINEQFEKDLTPSEFVATSRLALAFQRTVAVNLVDEEQQEQSQEAFKNIMGMLDQVEAFRKDNTEFEFK